MGGPAPSTPEPSGPERVFRRSGDSDLLDTTQLSQYLVCDPAKLYRAGETQVCSILNVFLKDPALAASVLFDYGASKEDASQMRTIRGNLYITNFALYFIPYFHTTYAQIRQQACTYALSESFPQGLPLLVADGVSVRDIRNSGRPAALELMGALPPKIIPHLCIFKVQKVHSMASKKKKKQGLEVLTKDFRCLRLAFLSTSADSDSRTAFYQQLKSAMPSRPEDVFTFIHTKLSEYLPSLMSPEAGLVGAAIDGWNIYNEKAELQRILKANSQAWRITLANEQYALCDTYPKHLAVPINVSDEMLLEIKAFRSRGRLPALVWLHPKNIGVSLTRCAQPLAGLSRQRCPADEVMIAEIANTGPRTAGGEALLYLMDARPRVNAMANAAMGAGVEGKGAYKNTKIRFLGIDNIHAMRSSMVKLLETVQGGASSSGFFSSLDSSRWLDYIALILFSSVRIAKLMHVDALSVLIHCSDGWDRTPQLSSLPMLMLDSYYRSIEGFIILIEKEWVGFSHKFSDRCGLFSMGERDSEFSPVFLQFIDCCWQLTIQFPTAFEFNETMLIDILDSLCSGLYGSLLCNSYKEREDLQLFKHTTSLWTHFLVQREKYRNPLYQPSSAVYFPNCNIRHIQFWRNYYMRYDPSHRAAYSPSVLLEQAALATRQLQEQKERAEAALLKRSQLAQASIAHLEDRAFRLNYSLCLRYQEQLQAHQREIEELKAMLAVAVKGDGGRKDSQSTLSPRKPAPPKHAVTLGSLSPTASTMSLTTSSPLPPTKPTTQSGVVRPPPGSYIVCVDDRYLDLSEL